MEGVAAQQVVEELNGSIYQYKTIILSLNLSYVPEPIGGGGGRAGGARGASVIHISAYL